VRFQAPIHCFVCNVSGQARKPTTSPIANRQLVIAGHWDPRYPQAQQRAIELGLDDSVRFLGDVSEADLPALYNLATIFAFPSLYEGFGLPPLEA